MPDLGWKLTDDTLELIWGLRDQGYGARRISRLLEEREDVEVSVSTVSRALRAPRPPKKELSTPPSRDPRKQYKTSRVW